MAELSARTRGARDLFAPLGPTYDRYARLLSFGQDPRWRAFLVSRVPAEATRVLDVACGTAAVSIELARAVPERTIVGIDQSAEMLAAGRERVARAGLAGTICFLHPKGTRGVLVEFATPPPGDAHHASAGRGALAGLALGEVTARSRDTGAAATLFVDKLGLERAGADAVTVAGVRLRFLADDTGSEGLAGLVLEVADAVAARAALEGYGPAAAPDGFHLDPARCRGVSLRLRRGA